MMLDTWKKRRALQKQIKSVAEELAIARAQKERDLKVVQGLQSKLSSLNHRSNRFEGDLLLKEARRRGIDVPHRSDWWANDAEQYHNISIPSYELDDLIEWWLTETGRFAVFRLIKLDKRANLEWWLKVLAALTGLGGTAIGIISVLKR
jgi:hypothetical protein